MKGQPDRISRYGFHPVPGIGRNQKKVTGFQRRIPSRIKPQHGLATGEHPEAILVNPLNVGIASDTVDLPLTQRRLARFLYLSERTGRKRHIS